MIRNLVLFGAAGVIGVWLMILGRPSGWVRRRGYLIEAMASDASRSWRVCELHQLLPLRRWSYAVLQDDLDRLVAERVAVYDDHTLTGGCACRRYALDAAAYQRQVNVLDADVPGPFWLRPRAP